MQFGFTEPYLFDKPIQSGFTLYVQPLQLQPGAAKLPFWPDSNLIPLFNSAGRAEPAELRFGRIWRHGVRFLPAQAQLRAGRAGLWLRHLQYQDADHGGQHLLPYIDFQGVGGPNQLSGIRTSKITPSYTYNTRQSSHHAHWRQVALLLVLLREASWAATSTPSRPPSTQSISASGFKKGHVIGMHLLARFITGYGGKVAPPFSRYYMGGENDIRGFDIWGISPIAFLPTDRHGQRLNNDGTQRMQKQIVNGLPTFQPVTMTIPTYQFAFPGGDTNVGRQLRIPHSDFRTRSAGDISPTPASTSSRCPAS